MLREILQALRFVGKRPLFSLAVVLTLGLGIGAAVSVFSLVDGVLLRPLDYPQADRLVRVHGTYERLRTSTSPRLQAIWNRLPVSHLTAEDLRTLERSFAAVGLYQESSWVLEHGGEPRRLSGAEIDAGVLPALGVCPLWGRGFEKMEVGRSEDLVLLSHGLWQELYGGDRDAIAHGTVGKGAVGKGAVGKGAVGHDAIERILRLDGRSFTVVGVMPMGFRLPGRPHDRLWVPIRFDEQDRTLRDNFRYKAIGRLAKSATLSSARIDVDRFVAKWEPEESDEAAGVGVRLVPLHEQVVGESRPLLSLLLAVVAMVLVIACVNVANLQLVQAFRRREELAVRLALGAGRGRLVRQMLLESFLLALGGGVLGVLLALHGSRALVALVPGGLPRTEEVAVDGRVLLFALGVVFAATLLSGLAPALLSSGQRISGGLGAGRGQGMGGRVVHDVLAVAEIAMALMLTLGAGLLINSLVRLSSVDPGFRTESILVQEIELPAWSYGEVHRRQDFADRLLAAVAGQPQILGAVLTSKLPLPGPSLVGGFRIVGKDGGESGDWTQGRSAAQKMVSPGYFEALGIPVVRGRPFATGDHPERGRVVVINEAVAQLHWPQEDPVGAHITMTRGDEQVSYEVVGVVADIKHDGLDAASGALIYQPWMQGPGVSMTLVARVVGDPTAQMQAVRRVIRSLDESLPVEPATTLQALVQDSLQEPRSRTALVLVLTGLALALALMGTYAVIQISVSRRRREIGIRMALGARAGRVRAQVLRHTLILAIAGIALGIAGALWASRLFTGFLYGITPTDPPTYAAVAMLLTATALLAGYLPARWASKIDPAVVLRNDG